MPRRIPPEDGHRHSFHLLLGYKTAERLFELERIEGREDAVERLDDVLFHKIPYISDYI